MRIGIYTPYLDTAGGGEKYMLSIAQSLSSEHLVDVFLDKNLASFNLENLKERIEKLHGIDLSKIKFISSPFGTILDFFPRLFFLKKYDYVFYLTNGSVFLSTAKHNIIHFQSPLKNTTSDLWGRYKLSNWKKAIYNSKFTKELVEKSWPIKGEVLYPPINIDFFQSQKKKKQILTVGRFFGYTRSKKQDVMIEAFKNLIKKHDIKDWSFHLAGGMSDGDKPFLEELKKLAEGFEVFFHPEISLSNLKNLYGESSIYWHAAGYGEEDPQNFEHFGISTVEAMASGCVPVVINKGGQREIVENNISGLLWNDIDELVKQTIDLISNKNLRDKLSKSSKERSRIFSEEKFIEAVRRLVDA